MRLARRIAGLTVIAVLCASMLTPAAAMDMATGPGPGHFTSDNVQWISANPRHTGSSGGRLVGKYFYVTDPRGVYIYDVTNPASPVLAGSVPIAQAGQGAALMQEDPDTNGKVLIMNGVDPAAPSNGNRFLVIDVANKSAPRVMGSLASDDHTWSCIADCTYAIGRTGGIIDLTNPASPKTVGNWKQSVSGSGYTHDFTEVRPGRLMSAGQPSFYLDVTNPVQPVKLTTIKTSFRTFGYHSAVWPRVGQDRFLIMGTEVTPATVGQDCSGEGEVATYDATAVRAEDLDEEQNPDGMWGPANFSKVDSWEVPGSGLYADGKPPVYAEYCAHWFDAHPDWSDGGLLAVAHYTAGVRFLKVDQAGQISEVGWFQPVGGYMASAYWISKDIVYSLDYERGLDILRFIDQPDAQGLIKVANPGTRTTHGIAEHGCDTLEDPYGPTNETDGLILPIPEDKRDGSHTIRAVGSSVAPHDLDIWFFDEGCATMSGTGISGDNADEQGPIPEGAFFASVDLYTGPPTHVLVEIDP